MVVNLLLGAHSALLIVVYQFVWSTVSKTFAVPRQSYLPVCVVNCQWQMSNINICWYESILPSFLSLSLSVIFQSSQTTWNIDLSLQSRGCVAFFSQAPDWSSSCSLGVTGELSKGLRLFLTTWKKRFGVSPTSLACLFCYFLLKSINVFLVGIGSKFRSGSCFVMLHVRALSGALVAELHVDQLNARLEESERSLVVALKRFLGAQLGCSRFRLKLLGEDSKEIDDDAALTGPANFLDFQSSDVATNTAFISACAGGRMAEVERLLHAPQNPEARDTDNNWMGIHSAASNAHLAIVQLLLEAGVDKNATLQGGATALYLAAQNGHLDVLWLLLEAGCWQGCSKGRWRNSFAHGSSEWAFECCTFAAGGRCWQRCSKGRWRNSLAHGKCESPFVYCAIAARGRCWQRCSKGRWRNSFTHGNCESPFVYCAIAARGWCWQGCSKGRWRHSFAPCSSKSPSCAIAAWCWHWQRCSKERWHKSFAHVSSEWPFGRCAIAAGGWCQGCSKERWCNGSALGGCKSQFGCCAIAC